MAAPTPVSAPPPLHHDAIHKDFAGDFSTNPARSDTHSSQDEEPKLALRPVDTYQTTYEQPIEGALYRNGELILQPAPSRAPRDPMNLPFWRKVLAIICLSAFGALAASAELILGACLPVFAVIYAGYPATIIEIAFPFGRDPLSYLNDLGGPPIFDVYLLGSIPLLVIGVANLFLVPLSISIGRRPVAILTGILAIAGASWAGSSTSLGSHIGARCVQAVGAGSVESLIPFIIQDTVHVHQRNTWISAAFALQGLIIIAIGFAAPYIIIEVSWRWLYYITAICAAFFLFGVILFLPETRWKRTRDEINGIPRDDIDVIYPPRTWADDLLPFHGKLEWKKGVDAFVDVLRTCLYPHIIFITILNSGFIGAGFAAALTVSPALLTQPWAWPFEHLGFCLVAVLIGALLVGVITGGLADIVANWVARRRGSRIPENQLFNLILPSLCGIIGTVVFGITGEAQDKYHWSVFLMSLGFIAFGFLGCNSIGAVYVLECFPHLAGPALVNIASIRWIIAFFLVCWVPDWVLSLGYFKTFMIYTAIISALSLTIPVVYYYGPIWRNMLPSESVGASQEDRAAAEMEKEARQTRTNTEKTDADS